MVEGQIIEKMINEYRYDMLFSANNNVWTRLLCNKLRRSIVVSIPACHAGDRGSIPRDGTFCCFDDHFKSCCSFLLAAIFCVLFFHADNSLNRMVPHFSLLSSRQYLLHFVFGMTVASSLARTCHGRRWCGLPSTLPFYIQTVTLKRPLSSSLKPRKIQAFIEGAPSAAKTARSAALAEKRTLTRTAIHRMRVSDLRLELQSRQLDASGTKKDLIPRLLMTANNNQMQAAEHDADDIQTNAVSSSSPSSLTTSEEPNEPVDPNRRYILQVKGLSSLSSNGTGVGFVLIDEQDPTVFWEARKYLQGNRSVFEAEYSALVLAMRYALRRGVAHIVVQLDHHVIQQQIMGTFTVEKESLKGIYWKFMGCKENMASFSTNLIGFLDNHRASDLAKKALATGISLYVSDSYEPMALQFRKKLQHGVDPLENDHQAGQAIDADVTYMLQFDGGARSNPTGVAGAGMVIYDDQGKEIWCGWSFLDKMSNNSAEYWALLLGLKCALSLGIKKIRCQGDSELIIKQVNGLYRVKDAKLKALFEPTKEVAAQFEYILFEHIYRNANERADWLANYAMDTQTNHGFEEI
jgi:ribonuclease HI